MKKLFLSIGILFLFIIEIHADNNPIGSRTVFGGFYKNSKVVDNYAYVVTFAGLKIYDVSNSESPILVGLYNDNKYNDIDIVGNYAYIASDRVGLVVLNISNPKNPILMDSYRTSGSANSVTVKDEYAYIADGSGGLKIIDILNPSDLRLRGSISTSDANSVAISDNAAIVADGNSGLKYIDISNPAHPVEITSVNTPGKAYDVKLIGRYAYVADGREGIQVISITHIPFFGTTFTFMTVINSLELSLNGAEFMAYNIHIEDNMAYVASGLSGFMMVDISNLENPIKFGGHTLGYARGVYVFNHKAYVSYGTDGFVIYDISTPSWIVIKSKIDTSALSVNIAIKDNYAYITDRTKGLKIVDISDKLNPVYVGVLDDFTEDEDIIDIFIKGNYAYLADLNLGLHIIDITIPTAPRILSTLATNDFAMAIVIKGNYAYIADNTRGLFIADISNPMHPRHVGNIDTLSFAEDVAVLDNYVYLSDGSAGMQVIDVSNPEHPNIVNNYPISDSLYSIHLNGKYAYLSDGGNGVIIVDISHPRGLLEAVGNYSASDTTIGVNVANHKAYILDSIGGVKVLDIKNISSPIEINHYVIKGRPSTIKIIDDYMYIASGYAGLTIVKVRDRVEDFVSRFYNTILLREADIAGLTDWSRKLKSLSKAGADIAKGFIFSPEFISRDLNDEAYVKVLYRAFFDREADLAGLQTWLDIINRSSNKAEAKKDVLDGFLNSVEFKALSDSYGIIANATAVELFVSRFYTQTLERLPDEVGLRTWTDVLNSGAFSGADVANGFILSEEFISKGLNKTEYLNVLYRAFFGREADEAGFNVWMTLMNEGTTREEVLQGFLGSHEFIVLADEYGIRAN